MKDKICNKTKFISQYINGELDTKKYADIKAHIENCSICQDEYNSLKEADDFLSLYKEEDVPRILNQKILNNSQIYKTHFSFMKSLAMAASFLIAFILGIYISNASLDTNTNDTAYDFGSETLYSLFDGEN